MARWNDAEIIVVDDAVTLRRADYPRALGVAVVNPVSEMFPADEKVATLSMARPARFEPTLVERALASREHLLAGLVSHLRAALRERQTATITFEDLAAYFSRQIERARR